MNRLAGTTFDAYARCDSSTFLKNGFLADSAAANSSHTLRKALLISGGVVSNFTLCFSTHSAMASAFSRCHDAHQRRNVSDVADRIASRCWGVRLSQTSLLMASSATEALSCMPGV